MRVELVYMQYNIIDSQDQFWCSVCITLEMASLDTLFLNSAVLMLCVFFLCPGFVPSLFLIFLPKSRLNKSVLMKNAFCFYIMLLCILIVSSPLKLGGGGGSCSWNLDKEGGHKKLLRNRGWVERGFLLERVGFPNCFISFPSEKHVFIIIRFFSSGKYSHLL